MRSKFLTSAVLALALSGCGGGGGSQSPVELPTPAPTSTPVPTPSPTPGPLVNDGFVKVPPVASTDGATYGIRTFQGLPSLARVGNRLWAVWYGDNETPGGEFTGTYLILSYSDDEGTSWSREYYLVPANPTTDRVAETRLWLAPDGALWVLYMQSGNSQGNDANLTTWATVISNPLETTPNFERGFFLGYGVPMRPFQYNGRWLIPIDFNAAPTTSHKDRVGKFIYDFDWRNRAVTKIAKVPDSVNRDFDETTYVQLKNGSVLNQSRTNSGIVQSISSTTSLDFPTPRLFTAFPSVPSRHAIARSPSGRLVMVWNQRLVSNLRTDMTIAFSDDEGATWRYSYVFDSRSQISYPDVDFAANGDILVVYDRERWGQKEIVLARISESSVIAGTPSVTLKTIDKRR